MQSALDKSNHPRRRNYPKIKQVMDTWINQNYYPVLYVRRHFKLDIMIITQIGTPENKGISNKWWIPITYATKSNPDFSKTTPSKWIGPNETVTIDVQLNDWVVVNVQQLGIKQ